MPTLTYPSDAFPAIASVSLEVGDAWSPLAVPAAVLAVARAVEPGSFISNLLVIARRVTPAATHAEAVAAYLPTQASRVDAVVTRSGDLTIGGLTFFGHEMAFTVAPATGPGVRILQSTRLGLVDRGPVKDLFEVTATVAADRVDHDYVEVQRMLETLTFG